MSILHQTLSLQRRSLETCPSKTQRQGNRFVRFQTEDWNIMPIKTQDNRTEGYVCEK